MGRWATAITLNAATLTNPPRDDEFDRIIRGPNKRKGQISRSRLSDVSPREPSSRIPSIVYNFGPPQQTGHNTPHSKRAKYAHEVSSSPIVGYSSHEYRDSALLDFLSWCKESMGDGAGDQFTDAYEKLQMEDVGIDSLGSTTAQELRETCGIKYGTVLRIMKYYPKWRQYLKSIVIYPNVAMSKLIPSNLRSNNSHCSQ